MAIIIDGKNMAAELRNDIALELETYFAQGLRKPGLAVVLVGNNSASKLYVKNKHHACLEVDINSYIHHLPASITEKDLLDLIIDLNKDERVDGILCQLPLPKHLSEKTIIDTISPNKDVDGFHPINSGKLFTGGDSFLPCTAAGIIYMLEKIEFSFEGKNALVIGRSNIVGKPTAILLLNRNCTVTIAHSKSKNIKELTQKAELLVTAAGQENLITKEHVNSDQVIIDVSMNRNSNGKVVGDVDFKKVEPLVKAITPVPGGVGPMTIAMLLKNTVTAYKKSIGI